MANEPEPHPVFSTALAHHAADPFRLLVESVVDYAIIMLDPALHIVSWNPGAERIYGYSRGEILGQPVARLYRAEDVSAGKVQQAFEATLRDGRHEEEVVLVRKDGSPFWAIVTTTDLHDHFGRHVGFAIVTRDITERKQAEEQLRAAEERFRLLMEGVKDYAIFLLDANGCVVSWNSGAELITGYSAAEVLGQPYALFFAAADVAAGQPERELEYAAAHGTYDDEGWRVRKDGSRYWANGVLTALYDSQGRVRGYAKIVRDLTERQQSETKLGAMALRLRTALEAGRMGSWSWEVDTNMTYWDKMLYELLGLPPGDGGMDLAEFFKRVHPEDLPRLQATREQILQAGVDFSDEFRIIRPDGEIRWLKGQGRLIRDEQTGRPLRMVGVTSDITEAKRAELELRQSEERFRLVFDKAVYAGVLTSIPDGIIVDINEAFTRLFGFSKSEIQGKSAIELGIYTLADRQRMLAAFATHSRLRDYPLAIRTKGGEVRRVLVNSDPLELWG